jgi:hypothetical protein
VQALGGKLQGAAGAGSPAGVKGSLYFGNGRSSFIQISAGLS